jgi:hypothetical protein
MEGKNLAMLDQLAKQLVRDTEAARQSLVRLTAASILYLLSRDFCALRYKHVHVERKTQEEPTEKELRKALFKYAAFGITLPDGTVPELPKIRGGKPSADEKRILRQAENLQGHLKEMGVEITDTDVPVEYVYSQYILIEDRIDALALWPTAEGEMEPVVLLPTMTSSVRNTYERNGSCWGNFWLMDHTRAFLQMAVQSGMSGTPHAFAYAVYEYTSRMDYDFIRLTLDGTHKAELVQSVERAFTHHRQAVLAGFPTTPKYEACADCPVQGCPDRVRLKPVRTMN